MNLGAFDFLPKPIDFTDLEQTIEKAIAQISKQKAIFSKISYPMQTIPKDSSIQVAANRN
jgi:FixJ family two-component response regulator